MVADPRLLGLLTLMVLRTHLQMPPGFDGGSWTRLGPTGPVVSGDEAAAWLVKSGLPLVVNAAKNGDTLVVMTRAPTEDEREELAYAAAESAKAVQRLSMVRPEASSVLVKAGASSLVVPLDVMLEWEGSILCEQCSYGWGKAPPDSDVNLLAVVTFFSDEGPGEGHEPPRASPRQSKQR